MALPLIGAVGGKLLGVAGDLFHIGGKSDAERTEIRVARAANLLDCAMRGDIAAARTVLAEQTYSSTEGGKAAYREAWSRLVAARPDVAQVAQQRGALRDSPDSGACTRFEMGIVPIMAAPPSPPPSQPFQPPAAAPVWTPPAPSSGGTGGATVVSGGSTVGAPPYIPPTLPAAPFSNTAISTTGLLVVGGVVLLGMLVLRR